MAQKDSTSNIAEEGLMNPEGVYKMLHKVRSQVGITFDESSEAAYAVLGSLKCHLPRSADDITKIMRHLKQLPLEEVSNAVIDDTEDLKMLMRLSDKMMDIKNDAEQRNWELYNDAEMIIETVMKMRKTMVSTDDAVCKRFLKKDEYNLPVTLAEYYQMEKRTVLKQTVLGFLCTIIAVCMDATVVDVLLNNTAQFIPQIANELVTNRENDDSMVKVRLKFLSLIFSTGCPMPYNVRENLGEDFIGSILDIIEKFTNENVVKNAITFVLMYNLQFKREFQDNIIVKALSSAPNPKTFTEHLLLLFNRNEDPAKDLQLLDNYKENSILKLMRDIFSSESTIKIFYKNDVKVLVDIVTRHLVDISADNKERVQWLLLMQKIMASSVWDEYQNDYQSVVRGCLIRIWNEESNEREKYVLLEMKKSFPLYFE